jgi:Fe-S cluster assembly protein SufD
MKQATLSMDAMQSAVAALPEDRLSLSRQAAFEQLQRDGLPSTREEDWKYTDLSKLVDIANDWLHSSDGKASSTDDVAGADSVRESIDADWLIIANGQVDATALSDRVPAGVNITQLSDAGGKLHSTGRLGNFNLALLRDGLRIEVSKDAEFVRPIGILVIDRADAQASVSQVRVDIDIAAAARASFVEFHISSGSADAYTNSVVNLTLGDHASVEFVRIQDRARHHNQTGYLSADVGRNANFRHCAFDFGGRVVRNDVVVEIAHPGSHSAFDGLYLVGDGQHIDNHTRAEHRIGPADSQQEYRGILTGKARGVWNGKAIVHKGADGTDAEQANHNLLLSKKAEIDAKPELEIYADDVKCSHGTTVGQLDEAALFYLQSRGLNRRNAKQVLTRAFAQVIVSKSPIASLHEFLGNKISMHLDAMMQETDE